MASETSIMAVIRASRPSFRNPHDKLAFFVHSFFLAAGYSLNATGNRALSAPTSALTEEEVGIDGWNELEGVYGFIYSKMEKGVKKLVLVKCLPIGDVLVTDVLVLNGSEMEPLNIQINTKEYLSDSVSPSNYAEVYNNIGDLVGKINSDVFVKLEAKAGSSSSTRSTVQARNNVVTREPPSEARNQEPSHPSGLIYPPVAPAGISDLYPGPGAGFYPDRGLGIGGGGMLVGPNDPRFFGSVEPPPFRGGIPGVPPGARFDPYGPPGVPGFEPGRFIRQPRPPGRGAHPDTQHFPDPDYI